MADLVESVPRVRVRTSQDRARDQLADLAVLNERLAGKDGADAAAIRYPAGPSNPHPMPQRLRPAAAAWCRAQTQRGGRLWGQIVGALAQGACAWCHLALGLRPPAGSAWST